jgi:hypothetical protein
LYYAGTLLKHGFAEMLHASGGCDITNVCKVYALTENDQLDTTPYVWETDIRIS